MNKFAFIIHPLKLTDFTRKYSWAKGLPGPMLERITRLMPPLKVSHITGVRSNTGKEIEGYFIACPLSSKQMLELPTKKVINKIIRAGKLAEKLGAEIVGLGAFTSVVGDKGITVARELKIPVTTGNSYTVATAVEGTKLAAEKMGHNLKDVTVTIIGATGSIGRAVSLLMSTEVNKLQLVARSPLELQKLAAEIKLHKHNIKIEVSTEIEMSVRRSEIIISASGAVESLIEPEFLMPGAVVCDVARPRDVADKVGRARDDVLVIEGGIVQVPGPVDFNFNFGYPPGTSYACMAETMLLTLEGRYEDYSLGPAIELEKVEETADLARKHGFKLAGLRSFERALSEERLKEIRNNAGNGSKKDELGSVSSLGK